MLVHEGGADLSRLHGTCELTLWWSVCVSCRPLTRPTPGNQTILPAVVGRLAYAVSPWCNSSPTRSLCPLPLPPSCRGNDDLYLPSMTEAYLSSRLITKALPEPQHSHPPSSCSSVPVKTRLSVKRNTQTQTIALRCLNRHSVQTVCHSRAAFPLLRLAPVHVLCMVACLLSDSFRGARRGRGLARA